MRFLSKSSVWVTKWGVCPAEAVRAPLRERRLRVRQVLEIFCDGITHQDHRFCSRQDPEIEVVTPRSILRERIFLDVIEGQALDGYLVRNSSVLKNLFE